MADLATYVGDGAECPAGGIRVLGMVAEIEARMEPVRLGDGVPDRLLFGDDFRVPLGVMAVQTALCGAVLTCLHP